MSDPVVAQVLGIDVMFSAADRAFWANVPKVETRRERQYEGFIKVEGKTIDAVEKAIVETFAPRRKVLVTQGSVREYDTKMSSITVPSAIEITGFYLEQTRGRGATKSVKYVLGNGDHASVNTAFKRYDASVAAEIKRLKEEFVEIEKKYVAEAKAHLLKLEKISAEEILAEMNKEASVEERSEGEIPDAFRGAFEN